MKIKYNGTIAIQLTLAKKIMPNQTADISKDEYLSIKDIPGVEVVKQQRKKQNDNAAD